MNLPQDLKDYKADSFQLIEEETAGWLIFAALVLMLILDRVL